MNCSTGRAAGLRTSTVASASDHRLPSKTPCSCLVSGHGVLLLMFNGPDAGVIVTRQRRLPLAGPIRNGLDQSAPRCERNRQTCKEPDSRNSCRWMQAHRSAVTGTG